MSGIFLKARPLYYSSLFCTPNILNFWDINRVHKPLFFNNGGKKWLKVVKSGKNIHIFAKIFKIKP